MTQNSPDKFSRLSITARLVCQELDSRGVNIMVISERPSWVRYFHKNEWHNLRSVLSEKANAMASVMANDKYFTALFCRQFDIPHPLTARYENPEQAAAFLAEAGCVVVKPKGGAHGNGITVGVVAETELQRAVEYALRYSSEVILQQYVQGSDYRVLFIDGQFIASLKRTPASVTGDGISAVDILIDRENGNPERGEGYEKSMVRISKERVIEFIGREKLLYIPKDGEVVQLVGVSNISSGGSAMDVTNSIPESMKRHTRTIVDELKMGICGADFLWDGVGEPLLIEFNVNPGIDIHDLPAFGGPKGAITSFVDYLLKNN